MKQFKCSRCKKWREVPTGWTYKECQECHNRSIRKSANLTQQQLENLAVKRLIDFDSAWQNYKRFCRKWKRKPKPKADFMTEWMEQQKPKIANIKGIITKYGSEFPLGDITCLRFRSMLTDRNGNSQWQPKDDDELNIWLNHNLQCTACTGYYQAHKSDGVLVVPFCEDGVSQHNFNGFLDGFFSEVLPKKDSYEEWERSQGLKEVCTQCGRQLMPNGRCPNGCELY